jgi:hypothetical protein
MKNKNKPPLFPSQRVLPSTQVKSGILPRSMYNKY